MTSTNNNEIDIKTIALAGKRFYSRRAKGLGSKSKEYKNEKGSSAVQPCQFLLNKNGQTIANKMAFPYITEALEASLVDSAAELHASGCIINTTGKFLSVVMNTPQFEELSQIVKNKMLVEINLNGFIKKPDSE